MHRLIYQTCFALGLLLLLIPLPAQSFGLKTHLWMAQQVRADLIADCRVTIQTKAYLVSSSICEAVRSYPEAFYAGVLGPDIYPDIVTGQVTTHPGIPDGWQTADFMERLLDKASQPHEKAYAIGYLLHAAGDVMAHSYVNHYAGDIFVLGDERAVELRHVLIEKFIDARLPATSIPGFSAPTDFVRDQLLHDTDTGRQYLKSGLAAHTGSMAEVRRTVVDAVDRTEELEEFVAKLVQQYAALELEHRVKAASGEEALLASEAALQLKQNELRLKQQAVVIAQEALKSATDALDSNLEEINDLTSQAKAQRDFINQAGAANNSMQKTLSDLRYQADNLVSQTLGMATTIPKQVCDIIEQEECKLDESCILLPMFCANICVMKEVQGPCTIIEEVNQALVNLQNQINGINQQARQFEYQLQESATNIAVAVNNETSLLQNKAQVEAQRAGLQLTRNAAEAALQLARAQLEAETRAYQTAEEGVRHVRKEVEKLRKQLADTQAIAETIGRLVNELNVLSLLFRNWKDGIDISGAEYIKVADRIAGGMLNGKSNLFFEYQRWLACRGNVYTATPYQIAQVPCNLETEYAKAKAELDRIILMLLPPPLAELQAKIDDLKKQMENEIRKAVEQASIKLVAFVSDPSTAELLDVLANPDKASEASLNEALGRSSDSNDKALIKFAHGADAIKLDIGLNGTVLDPVRFRALDAAITLAKLSLLTDDSLRALVSELGGNEATARLAIVKPNLSQSILLQSVRSIDGNHQWQPYGLPYPRADLKPQPENPQLRRFGYGAPGDPRKGFWLFTDRTLRELVFRKLFRYSIQGAIIANPAMNSANYPFPLCDKNPFPATFIAGGAPALLDSTCNSQ